MKFTYRAVIILLSLVLCVGCATIKGNNFAEQREYVLDVKTDTLANLYNEYPIAKEQIKNFSNYIVS